MYNPGSPNFMLLLFSLQQISITKIVSKCLHLLCLYKDWISVLWIEYQPSLTKYPLVLNYVLCCHHSIIGCQISMKLDKSVQNQINSDEFTFQGSAVNVKVTGAKNRTLSSFYFSSDFEVAFRVFKSKMHVTVTINRKRTKHGLHLCCTMYQHIS